MIKVQWIDTDKLERHDFDIPKPPRFWLILAFYGVIMWLTRDRSKAST